MITSVFAFPVAGQELVSRDNLDLPGNQSSTQPSLSGDGRKVVFLSDSDNLVSGDNNGLRDAFLYNRDTGVTERVSLGLKNSVVTEPNAQVTSAKISKDGNYVVFATKSSNLIDSDTNDCADVFLRDLQAQTTVRISQTPAGVEADGSSGCISISDDGTFIGFCSDATNLVAGDTNAVTDYFRYEVVSGGSDIVSLVSLGDTGQLGNGNVIDGSLSGDGNVVAFTSASDNLVAGITNQNTNVFVRNVSSSSTLLINADSAGVSGNGPSGRAFVSGDGEWVAFASVANNLVTGDTNSRRDVFIKNIGSGADADKVWLVSKSQTGGSSNNRSYPTGISENGQFVSFDSFATNLDPLDTSTDRDAYLFDRVSGEAKVLDQATGGVMGNSKSQSATVSADGSELAFQTLSSNLGVTDTNSSWDVFALANPLKRELVSISVSSGSVVEGGSVTYTITRAEILSTSLEINLQFSGTATEGSDVLGFSSIVSIPENSSSVDLTLTAFNDSEVENSESATVSIANSANYFAIEGQSEATATILDDDTYTVSLATLDSQLSENPLSSGLFRVSRLGGTVGDLVVNLAFSGDAVNGVDYSTISPTVVILEGNQSVDVEVFPIDDLLPEGEESLQVSIVADPGYATDGSVANLRIEDDDKSQVFITSLSPILLEGSGSGQFRVERTTAFGDIDVALVFQGTAIYGLDYPAVSTQVSLADGEFSKDILVSATSDSLAEDTETIIARVLEGKIYDVIQPNSASILIVDAVSSQKVSVEAVQPNISEDGSVPGTFRVTRTGTSGVLTVNFSVSGSATPGVDYQSFGTSATIADGFSSAIVSVVGLEDSLLESAESVTVTLSSGLGYAIDPLKDSATLFVQDNEPTTFRVINQLDSAREGWQEKLSFVIKRSGDLSQAATAQVEITGTAQSTADYLLDLSELAFQPYQSEKTIDLDVLDDAVFEGSESVVIELKPDVSYQLGEEIQVRMSILDAIRPLENLQLSGAPLSHLSTSLGGGSSYVRSGQGIFVWQSGAESPHLASNGESPNSVDLEPTLSASGQFLLFTSASTNHVSDPEIAGFFEVYLKDLNTGVTTWVSKETQGSSAIKSSRFPQMSDGAEYIVFESSADFLTIGDGNSKTDVFLYKRADGSIKRISTAAFPDLISSTRPTISPDGSTVLFQAKYSSATGGFERLFKYDVASEALTVLFSFVQEFDEYKVVKDPLGQEVVYFSTRQQGFSDGGGEVFEPTQLARIFSSVNGGFPVRVLQSRIPGLLEGRMVGFSTDSQARFLSFFSDSGLIDETSDVCNLVPFVYDRLTDSARRLFQTDSSNCIDSHFSSISISADGQLIRFSGLVTQVHDRYQIFEAANPFFRAN